MKDHLSGYPSVLVTARNMGVAEAGDNDDAVAAKIIALMKSDVVQECLAPKTEEETKEEETKEEETSPKDGGDNPFS